jgi:hypothetical protein
MEMKKIFFALFFAGVALIVFPMKGWAPGPPCVDIEKYVSVDGGVTWSDADVVGEAPSTSNGAMYKLSVENCGVQVLTDVTITDDDLGIAVNIGNVAPSDGILIFTSNDQGFENLDQPGRCDDLDPPDKLNTARVLGYGEVYGEATDEDPAWVNCEEEEGECWLTAGGVKFDPIAGMNVAQHDNSNGNGPKDSVGGVVYPSCDPDPGNGGNWNHIFHKAKWHLKGTDITVVRCGNVEGIEPGSESPVCPLNFIEFVGTGTLAGIGGNKAECSVHFFARAEDRNEPGNEQANPNGGAYIDRYFLQVFDAGTNALLLEVSDENGDPITITGGNFQIHCSSCE